MLYTHLRVSLFTLILLGVIEALHMCVLDTIKASSSQRFHYVNMTHILPAIFLTFPVHAGPESDFPVHS